MPYPGGGGLKALKGQEVQRANIFLFLAYILRLDPTECALPGYLSSAAASNGEGATLNLRR